MMMVYGRSFSRRIELTDAVNFYNHRVARIIPLLALVAVLKLSLDFTFSHDGHYQQFGKFFLTATGAFSLQAPGFLSSTTGAWSLGIEGFFYMVFPVLALMAMNISVLKLGLATLFLVMAQQTLLLLLSDRISDGTAHWNLYISPLTFAPFFMLGILIYRSTPENKTLNLMWCLISFAAIIGFSLVQSVEILTNPTAFLLLSGLSALSVCLAYRSNIGARIRPLCSFLGDVSYALYLTHWIANTLVQKFSRSISLPQWLEFAAFIIVAVAGAYLSYILFERPARNFIRRRCWVPEIAARPS